jgi:hypothetical protein
MEDVILNGTKNRKPLSFCEASLLIHNSRKILPIEYNDVEITRRLYRSGESQFYINKTQCRLKDIHNLLQRFQKELKQIKHTDFFVNHIYQSLYDRIHRIIENIEIIELNSNLKLNTLKNEIKEKLYYYVEITKKKSANNISINSTSGTMRIDNSIQGY